LQSAVIIDFGLELFDFVR